MKSQTFKLLAVVLSFTLCTLNFAALVPSASAASYVNVAVPTNTNLTSGLLLFYTFDSTKFSTTTVTDESGNGKTGTPSVARAAVAGGANVETLVVAGGGGGGRGRPSGGRRGGGGRGGVGGGGGGGGGGGRGNTDAQG